MKTRIKNMLDFKKTLQWAIMVCSFVLVLFTVGCANNPPQSLSTDNLVSSSMKNELNDVAAVDSRLSMTNISADNQTVVYENVELFRYTGTDGHPYIHDIKTNSTNKNIEGCKRGMLAYDKDGQPLKVDWYTLDQSLDQTFYYLCDWNSFEILSGETDDKFGGWSLNYWEDDLAVDEIAYVLYCDKEITFEDGTVWENPNFEDWLNIYEGKTIDVKVLENYYPYVQKIVF